MSGGDIDEDDLFLLPPEMRAKCREITNEDPQRWNNSTPTKIDLNKHATLSRKLQKFVEKQSLKKKQKRASIVSMISMTSIDETEEGDGSVESLPVSTPTPTPSKEKQEKPHTKVSKRRSAPVEIDYGKYEETGVKFRQNSPPPSPDLEFSDQIDENEEFFDAEDFESQEMSLADSISIDTDVENGDMTPAQKAQAKLSSVSEETLDGRGSNDSRSLVSSTNSDKSSTISPRTAAEQQNGVTPGNPVKKEKKHVVISDPIESRDEEDAAKQAAINAMTQSAYPALTSTPLSRKMSAGNEGLRVKESISPMTALTIQMEGLNLQKPTTSSTFPLSLQEQTHRIASVSHTTSLNEINELARQQEEALRRMASLSGLGPVKTERASRLPKPTGRSGILPPGFSAKRPTSARSTSAHPPESLSIARLHLAAPGNGESPRTTPGRGARLRAPSASAPHRYRPLQLHPRSQPLSNVHF